MELGDRDAPDNRPADGPWTTAGTLLLLVSATTQLVYGAAAIAGVSALEDNVRKIESDPSFGKLYLSLAAWGVLLALVGAAELGAAWALARRRPYARLMGLGAALFGLGVAFFTLAIFHGAALITVGLLLLALYVLSYRVRDRDDDHG
jgi:hypothetical protein